MHPDIYRTEKTGPGAQRCVWSKGQVCARDAKESKSPGIAGTVESGPACVLGRSSVPQERLKTFPAVSAVPAGLAELVDVYPGLEHFHFYSEQDRAAKCGFS